jgi:hypothetical protein
MTVLARSCPPGACTCGCCLGLTAFTPVKLYNRQGLTAIAYRVGTQPLFKRSMLAALSSSAHKALLGLGTRDDDDFSIALLDAWACVADVLTFYQERIANESYLLTATERQSLLQLARLIGYELGPGVAANAWIAFTLETAQGAPSRTSIDAGAKIQSVPGPNETPQTFETGQAFEARANWNALQPLLSIPQRMTRGLRQLYLQGVDTQLQPGDAILIIGSERETDSGSERWDFRLLDTVEVDTGADLTRVTWLEGLGHEVPDVEPAQTGVQVFAMRQRAALFGHNAPDAVLLHLDRAARSKLTDGHGNWSGYTLNPKQIDLDAVYPKITARSWLVLESPTHTEVVRANQVFTTSVSRFALSGKLTRVVPDPDVLENANEFSLQGTTVYGQSEALEVAERPVTDPVYGSAADLEQLAPDLQPGRALAFTGKRQRLQITRLARNLTLKAISGATATLAPGDSLLVLAAPVVPGPGAATTPISPAGLMMAFAATAPTTILWQLRDRNGFEGTLEFSGKPGAPTNFVALVPPEDVDEVVSEIAILNQSSNAVLSDLGRTSIKLSAALDNCYDRGSLTINANVVLATHGETVQEVLGAGEASRPYQSFFLKQSPLTYISAPTPTGGKSTLEVRVNDLLWREVPTLYGAGPRDRVYISRQSDDDKTTVEFGDGSTGARLPTGRDNVRARYRKGIGLAGLVRAGQLSQLMSRPLGVKSAVNPEEATDAKDPDSRVDARRNAPLTVLTLDRTVSLLDYEAFARSFGDIAKALATSGWDGHARRVFITVAGSNGAEVKADSETMTNLIAAITNAGDPFVSFSIKSYRKATFRLQAEVKVDEPTYVRKDVIDAIAASLRGHFSFGARDFAQGVALSEIIAVMQGLAGVVGVNVTRLYRSDAPVALNPGLAAGRPSIGTDGTLMAAELLMLDPAPLQIGVLQ